MSNPILYYKLDMPIIPYMIYITTGRDMLERAAKAKGMSEVPFIREYLEGINCKAGGCLPLQDLAVLLILPEEWDDEVVYHEALHCATRMWYDVGADLVVPKNDEVLTYTQGYIANYIKEVCYASTRNCSCNGSR